MLVWLKSKRHDAFLTNIVAPDFFFSFSRSTTLRVKRLRLFQFNCFRLLSDADETWGQTQQTAASCSRLLLGHRQSNRQCSPCRRLVWGTSNSISCSSTAGIQSCPVCCRTDDLRLSKKWAVGFFFFVFFLFRLRFFYSPRQSFYHWCFKWPVKTSTCVDFFLP